ncbi:MAG: hypothetical protein Q8K63_06515 [Acidimicrobiales bacterium]|nr:hypothetical protein [Acidimicrobiales bacterium]
MATQRNAANCKPGRHPVFTEKFLVQLRPDQRDALVWLAALTGQSQSSLIRWFIDNGLAAVRLAKKEIGWESTPSS